MRCTMSRPTILPGGRSKELDVLPRSRNFARRSACSRSRHSFLSPELGSRQLCAAGFTSSPSRFLA